MILLIAGRTEIVPFDSLQLTGSSFVLHEELTHFNSLVPSTVLFFTNPELQRYWNDPRFS